MSHGSPLTILLIDDCAEERIEICHCLRHELPYIYRIVEFVTTTEAIKWCQQEIPDVILLDFFLPDGNGLKFLEEFRKQFSPNQSAVILLTREEDEFIAVRAMKSGVQDYLVKGKLTAEVLQESIHHAVAPIHLRRQLEHSREQQQLIAAIALRIRQSLQLEEILRATATEVRQFLNADRVVVYQFHPDMSGSIVAESVLPGWTVALGKQIHDTCFQEGAGSDYRQGKKRAIDDIYQAGLTNCHLHVLEQFEVKANLVVPILVTGQLWGLLIAHQCSASRHWESVELDLLDQLAVQIAIAIQQANAYDQLQAELTEGKQTATALLESEARFVAFMNNSPTASWITDENGLLLYLSQTYLQTFQLNVETREELIGKTVVEIYSAEIAQQFVDNIRQVAQTQQIIEVIEKAPRPDNTLGYFLVYKFPLLRTSGQCLIGGVAVDITERVLAEQALEQLNQELEARVERRTAALRESEERVCKTQAHLLAAQRIANLGSWELDLHTQEIIWSQEVFHIFGRDPASGTPTYDEFRQLMHLGARTRHDVLVQQTIEQGKSYEIEYCSNRSDGTLLYLFSRGEVIFDADGKAVRLVGTVLDITERKQVEAALRDSERRYATLTEAAPVAILRLDAAGQCIYVNDCWSEMTGRSTQAALGIGWLQIIHPEDRDRLRLEWSQGFWQKGIYRNEGRHLHQDGSITWFYIQVLPETNPFGTIIGYIGTLTDITERKQIEEALQESERRYATLAEAAPVAIFRLDALGNCVYVNDRWSEMTGRPTQSALGTGWLEAIHPEDRVGVAPRRDHLLNRTSGNLQPGYDSEGKFHQNEGRHLRPDGSINWFYVQVVSEVNSDGIFIGYVGTFTDITDRKQTEEQLHYLSERLTLAISSGGFGIWEYDFAQDREIWDDRMYELYGLSNTDFNSSFDAWLNCLHPDDRVYMLETIEQVIQAKQEYNVEFRIVQPSGEIRFLKGYGILKRDQQGEPVRMIGVNLDISDRKQAELELTRNRDLREAIFNESADAIFLVDPQTLLTLDCNRQAVELFEAADKAELIGINGQTLQYRPFTASQTNMIVAEMQTKGVWSLEIEYITRQGKVFWGNIAAKPITVAGRTMHIVRLTDISDRKQAEAQLRQTNEQLANTNVELAQATRLKDEFLANMSHELRTPLNAILGMSEGLLESVFGTINERQAKAIATIERSGKHLLELINDILDLSKIESGKLELELSDVPVRTLCDSSLAFVKHIALKKNIHFSTHIATNLSTIQLDDRRLRQVLINLLSNAIKFTPEQGSVSLKVWLEEGQGGRGAGGAGGAGEAGEANSSSSPSSPSSPHPPLLCFSVTDTGIGIAPEDIDKLFQPFIQLDSSLNRQYSGTGLGLALVRRIAVLHGGTVSVSSEVGVGSCFTLRIPYRTNDGVSTTLVKAPLHSHQFPAENAQVLVIEDSVPASDQITRYLSEMKMEPVVYSKGEGAIDEVLRLGPALIVLDLQLPDLSGWDVLAQLKTNPQTQEIPIIITSVVDEHTKGFAQGAAEYLVKPITRPQFRATLDKLQHPNRPDSVTLIVEPSPTLESPVILLAEDNQGNIDTMSGYLESRGYRLILAKNGQQAIELAVAQHPNLIVMDIQMPEMDGLEAIRCIRSDRQFTHVPIIALTALAMPGDREICLAAGANEYLTKPIKLKQLALIIQKLLGK